MILRPASLDDVSALAALGRTSFCAAFEHLYSAEDLSSFLEQVYTEQAIAGEITGDLYTHHLACDDDEGGLAGYSKLKYPSDYGEYSDATNPIALAQLYTDPARTGLGIGAALMDWTLAEARQRGHDAIQLSVYSENYGAHRFYARYGFVKIADIGFWVGEQRNAEFLYELRLA